MVLSAIAMPALASPDASPFSDVPPTHWAYDSIVYCHDNNLVNGTGNGQFSPDKTLSYAEFVTMVVRVSTAILSEERFNENVKDPNNNAWWYRNMSFAQMFYLKDTAVDDPNFSWTSAQVNKNITRYDMALIVAAAVNLWGRNPLFPTLPGEYLFFRPTDEAIAAAKTKIGDFSNIPDKYQNAVAVCVAMGIISGVNNNGDFSGNTNVTRAQAAAILERCHKNCFVNVNLNHDAEVTAFKRGVEQQGTQPSTSPEPQPQPTPAPSTQQPTATPAPQTTDSVSTPNGTRWNKSSAYPTKGLSSTTPNKNGFYTAAPDAALNENAMLVYELLDLVNAERAKNSASPMKWVPCDEAEEYTLLRASESFALYHHADIDWVNQLWNELAPNGSWPNGAGMSHIRPYHAVHCGDSEVWASVGYFNSYSYEDGYKKAFEQWMNSAAHKRILMEEDGRQHYMVAAKCSDCFVIAIFGHVSFGAPITGPGLPALPSSAYENESGIIFIDWGTGYKPTVAKNVDGSIYLDMDGCAMLDGCDDWEGFVLGYTKYNNKAMVQTNYIFIP